METIITGAENVYGSVGLTTPGSRFVATGLVAAAALAYIKPRMMYDASGKALQFGTGPGQTLVPWWLASVGVGAVGYFFI